MINRSTIVICSLTFLTLALSLVLFLYGESGFLGNEMILWQLRFPKIMTAFLAGGLLATAGLLLQIFFQNPLAGPDILGVNAGASLGVAFALMATPYLPSYLSDLSIPIMATLGALAVLFFLIFFIHKKISSVGLLIIGLLIASFTSSIISLLVNMSSSLQVKNFLLWSMGSFQGNTNADLRLFGSLAIVVIFLVVFLPKKLNQLVVGENYARSMGLNVNSFKIILVIICSFLVATVTSFCGPIGFIGIIAPHVARSLLKNNNAHYLIPASFLFGSILALSTSMILVFATEYSLAANAILGLIGAPIIAVYLYHHRGIA